MDLPVAPTLRDGLELASLVAVSAATPPHDGSPGFSSVADSAATPRHDGFPLAPPVVDSVASSSSMVDMCGKCCSMRSMSKV